MSLSQPALPHLERPARVFVVEDDPKTLDVIALYLRHHGHVVDTARHGVEARHQLRATVFDLLILDVMLPGVSGLDLLRWEREQRMTPVILLTAQTLEHQRVAGLDLGADDYVTKPFSPRELVARAEAVLRRSRLSNESRLAVGSIVLDPDGHIAMAGGAPLALTRTEFALLKALLQSRGRAVSRAYLVSLLPNHDAGERTVDVHVSHLRRKLEACLGDERPIASVPGVGYRIVLPERTSQ